MWKTIVLIPFFFATAFAQITNSVTNQGNYIFKDSFGREVFFRGWNVSGAVKLTSTGFKAFKNISDAKKSLKLLREKTGSNIIRYTIAWEGAHLEVDTIDQKYLRDITEQIKEAIRNKIYILLDYHQDLFSRHLFHQDSKYTGNGAPKYIIEGSSYEKEGCLVCGIAWSVNTVLNKTITLAYRNFWNNIFIDTKKGKRDIQGEYLWQLEKVLNYLKKNLTPFEWNYILGLDPFNEPSDGGLEGLSDVEWNRQKLYPFYQKVRKIMNDSGWQKKTLFAEPIVVWNTSAPFTNANNPIYPDLKIENISFNAHYYDAIRMSLGISSIKNGAYMANMDHIRNYAKKVKAPPFLSEFGMWIEKGRVKNQVRIINATYQGMDASKEVDSNYIEFRTPLISGTQWHWGFYHNNHQEPLRGEVLKDNDAWNGENFSIITDYGGSYTTPDKYVVERSYPRACQGNLLHFYYNARPFDGRAKFLDWAAIRVEDKNHLDKDRFSFMAWEGSNSKAPTEIYLPLHFKLETTYLVTEKFVGKLSELKNQLLLKISDNTLYIYHSGKWSDIHFSLAINSTTPYSRDYLTDLQQKISKRLSMGKSPVYLMGKVRVDKVHVGKGKINFKNIKEQNY